MLALHCLKEKTDGPVMGQIREDARVRGTENEPSVKEPARERMQC
jgi:hypothetical protein